MAASHVSGMFEIKNTGEKMSAQLYAPDYLRAQKDTQLHSIAEMIESQAETMHSLRTENAELKERLLNYEKPTQPPTSEDER
jgi:regulator of replication initiation timing